jgi:CHAT domain-containing protein
VARTLSTSDSHVYLGARATERTLKMLSASGALRNYQVLHFATHGLLAGQAEIFSTDLSEPALLLTPPDSASDVDDGLLTASEIALLDLNAQWIILSACNTAGGVGKFKYDSEAFSGLARAFFYAGTDALLVSHWYVDSDAAVKLTTRAVTELRRNPGIGAAEALRRAMLAFLADPTRPADWQAAAHPSVWAPFVLVGRGWR